MIDLKERNLKGGYARPKIVANYGTNDYFKYYKKQKGRLERTPFAAILRDCNKALVEEILKEAEEFTLPCNMGRISFRKRKNKAYLSKEGIRSNALVDWKATMELWQRDLNAHRNKIMVKYNNMHTGRYSFRISLFNRTFINKEFFAFRFKRSFKRAFAKRIMTYNENKIEAQIVKTI